MIIKLTDKGKNVLYDKNPLSGDVLKTNYLYKLIGLGYYPNDLDQLDKDNLKDLCVIAKTNVSFCRVVEIAMINKLNWKEYVDLYDLKQFEEIIYGLMADIDVSVYADKKYHNQIMNTMRMCLEKGISVDNIKTGYKEMMMHKDKCQNELVQSEFLDVFINAVVNNNVDKLHEYMDIKPSYFPNEAYNIEFMLKTNFDKEKAKQHIRNHRFAYSLTKEIQEIKE